LSEETDKLTEEFMQELNLLQQALDEKERENDELDSKVKQLSKDLTSTTKEIENRTSALVDAVARIEVLEKKIADANKKILSKEVIIGDLTKEKKSLGELVHTKEEKIQQLENKLRLSFTLKQEEQMLEKKLQARLDDTEKRCALLATQLEKALSAIEIFHSQSKDAKQEYYAFIERTTKDNETLKLKMAKRETKMKKLNAQVVILTKQKDQLEKEKRQVEVGTKVKVEDQQEFKEKTQSIEKFRLELEQSRKDLDQERMNSVLVKKELCRLREQLILSEERRKTDVRRQVMLEILIIKAQLIIMCSYMLGAINTRKRTRSTIHMAKISSTSSSPSYLSGRLA
jgi:chromosome segregation ATPase